MKSAKQVAHTSFGPFEHAITETSDNVRFAP